MPQPHDTHAEQPRRSIRDSKPMQLMERGMEGFIFASRWFLAPFYVGLALSLLLLLIKFIEEFWHMASHALSATEAQIVVGVLTLVDMTLTGSLLIIVIFSGYENFVSKFDHADHKDWPAWMGTIDFSALKLKLLSSIVAISAIQLLKQFMEVKEMVAKDPVVANQQLYWYVVIHLVFVGSSVLLALSDRIAGHGDHAHAAGKGHDPGESHEASHKGGHEKV